MSNIGLSKAFEELDIKRLEAPVGDRLVLEKMIKHGAVLGGEDSGHIILLEHHTTGDGILTALQLLAVMQNTGKTLSELAKVMKTYPQILKNIEVKNKINLNEIPSIQDTIKEVEDDLGKNGRVVVRYSGTQPLLRIMVEATTEEKTSECVRKIAETAIKELS